MAPGIEGGLPRGQGGAGRSRQQLALQGAVEALVLAQGLGVIGAAVAHGDRVAQQPDGQRGVGVGRPVAPGAAVVDQDPIRQTIPLEGRHQLGAHRGGALIRARGQP